MSPIFEGFRRIVRSVLENHERYEWTLQGFGMLRTYVSRELRIHIWDHGYRVKDVTDIHDHPWHFDSVIISGTLVNTRYRVHPCTHTDEQIVAGGLRSPFLKSTIVCGVGGGNHVATVKDRGERVWLEPLAPETYKAGQHYHQDANEVHHSSFGSGTVTAVMRTFQPDTEHAHVFFKADEEWVSAEPRDAKPIEVESMVKNALANWT